MKKDPVLRTKEVLELTGISKPTLLSWIRKGKLDPPPERNPLNRYYIWTPDDVQRLLTLTRSAMTYPSEGTK